MRKNAGTRTQSPLTLCHSFEKRKEILAKKRAFFAKYFSRDFWRNKNNTALFRNSLLRSEGGNHARIVDQSGCEGSLSVRWPPQLYQPESRSDGHLQRIRPAAYPHVQKIFVVFAQLISGLGEVPFFIDIRFAATDEAIYTTDPHELVFPRRNCIVQMADTITGCEFPRPGIYLVELHCNGKWVADTTLDLA